MPYFSVVLGTGLDQIGNALAAASFAGLSVGMLAVQRLARLCLHAQSHGKTEEIRG